MQGYDLTNKLTTKCRRIRALDTAINPSVGIHYHVRYDPYVLKRIPSTIMPPTPTDEISADVQSFVRLLYQGCPRVYVTPTIVLLNGIVFIYMLFAGAGIMGENIDVYIEYGANYEPLTKNNEWWRLLTATFLHFGIIHLAFNMWALWDAGRLTERLYGHAGFFTIYFYSGLLGGVASLFWNQDITVSVGASGAVFSVFGALLAYLIRQKHTVPYALLKQLRHSALLFTGFALFYGFSVPGIDNAAHLGGLLGGFLLGSFLSRPIQSTQSCIGKTMYANVLSVLVILGVTSLLPPASFDYQSQKTADKNIEAFINEEKRLLERWRHITRQFDDDQIEKISDAIETLNDIHADWIAARQLVAQYGHIRKPTEALIKTLGTYATLRADNTRYLVLYLESTDPHYLASISENNRRIKAMLEEVNEER